MRINTATLGILALGIVVGAMSIAGISAVNHATSTDQFCGASCHSMQYLSSNPTFNQSAHRVNQSGVIAGCKDCHLPHGFVAETWAHISSGTKDLISTALNDFSDEAVWEAKRQTLAHQVRQKMLADDSENCRHCHAPLAHHGSRKGIGRQHELAERNGYTCIQCHFNLVHQPVEPAPDFKKGERLLPDYSRKLPE